MAIIWDVNGVFSYDRPVGPPIRGWARDAEVLAEFLSRAGYSIKINSLSRTGEGATSIRYSESECPGATSFTADINSLLSSDPRRDDLLDHLARLRTAIPLRPAEQREWLQQRAQTLNKEHRQAHDLIVFNPFHGVDNRSAERGQLVGLAGYCDWIDPSAVVVTPDPVWNEFSRRSQSVPIILEALRTADTATKRLQWLHKMFAEPPDLVRVEGPAGPIYQLGLGGSHRVHTCRLLQLPYMLAQVAFSGPRYPTRPTTEPRYPIAMIERIWRRLRKLGVVVAEINIDPDGDEIWSLNEVAAEWMLLTPQRAVDINRAYEQVYPGALTSATGLPISTLVNEQRWIAALTSPTPAEKLGGWLRQLAARSD